MKQLISAVIAATVLAFTLTFGSAATASAEPQPDEPVAAASESAPAQPVMPIGICMMPGDTIELRAVIGAVLGGLAGLPIFIIGAIPGALIGAGFGALSHVIASWSVQQMGGCTR